MAPAAGWGWLHHNCYGFALSILQFSRQFQFYACLNNVQASPRKDIHDGKDTLPPWCDVAADGIRGEYLCLEVTPQVRCGVVTVI